MNKTFQFNALPQPVAWTGRYNRIPGREPVLRTTAQGSAHANWTPWAGDELLTSSFVDSLMVSQMIATINQTKQELAGNAGGAFQINEYGQVLCPINGDAARYWVGDVTGVPMFHDPRNPGDTFELKLPPSTEPGTSWKRPYIGMKFNLDANDSIYFLADDGDIRIRSHLMNTDHRLIELLREVRGAGKNIRFIVNLHGCVITKKEPNWEPVFVGYIDPENWFPKQH